jgi:hypothetical protein
MDVWIGGGMRERKVVYIFEGCVELALHMGV